MERLRVEEVVVHRAGRPVLREVSFCLQAGELVGLIGPNGCGKSTLMRALSGQLPLKSGWFCIDGLALADDRCAALRRLGYAVDPERLPRLLSGRQCLELLLDLRDERAAAADCWRLADALGLSPWLDRPVHQYSLGTRQKLAIVQALLGEPALIVLDEVLNGLDPLAAYALKAELRRCSARGAAVLLATHGLEVAERFLDRALLLLDGRIAADWDAAALAAMRADPEGGLEHAVAERLRQAQGGAR